MIKIYSVEGTNLAAWDQLVKDFRAEIQADRIDVLPAPAPHVYADTVDAAAFLQDWSALKDTHDFFPMLMKYKVSRIKALQTAEGRFSRRVEHDAVKILLEQAAALELEIMEVPLEDAFKGGTRQIVVNGSRLNIKLNPGLYEGQIIRLKGKGAPGRGGENGDLLISIKLASHPGFELKGKDIYGDVDVDLYTAVIGGKITVQGLGGPLNMNIPAETDSGRVFRLKGMGMPDYNNASQPGDLYLTATVHIPQHLTDKEKELFTELARLRKQ